MLSSKRIRRLDKEAILRAKESEHKREQSAHLLSSLNRDAEDDEEDRHRRFDLMRQTRQILRDVEHQQKVTDKMQERIQQDWQKRQAQTTKTTTRTYTSSTSASLVPDRANRGSVTVKVTLATNMVAAASFIKTIDDCITVLSRKN